MTPDHEDALPILRHSAAHLFAQAARRLSQTFTWVLVQPSRTASTTILTTQLVKSLTKTFLVSKKKCKKIVKENFPSIREEVTKNEAREIFKNDPYKLELIEEHSEDEGGLTIVIVRVNM